MRQRNKFFKETKERAEELGRQIAEEAPLGCREIFSMIFSAYLVIFLIAAGILAGIGALLLLIIGAF